MFQPQLQLMLALLAQFDAYQPPRLEDWLATLAPPGAASGPA